MRFRSLIVLRQFVLKVIENAIEVQVVGYTLIRKSSLYWMHQLTSLDKLLVKTNLLGNIIQEGQDFLLLFLTNIVRHARVFDEGTAVQVDIEFVLNSVHVVEARANDGIRDGG